MDDQPPNYRAEFFKSPQHAALGVLTLGLGFLSAELVPLIVGATLYALGWIYLPDIGFFRHWVDRRNAAGKQAAELQKVGEFVKRRDTLLATISPSKCEQYSRLAQVCRDIENASADNVLASPDSNSDPRLRKLDELMWTYLRLLGIEESLERFLEIERGENVPALLQDAETEVNRLNAEVDDLKKKGDAATIETRQRYLSSRMERLEVLRKRRQRTDQAESNLQLVVAEQERLDQQIKLIRADAVAAKNAETLTARIDATVEHLDQTNKWLAEFDEFKDLVGDMPNTELRVGYQASAPAPTSAPPVIQPIATKRAAARQRQT
jgi:outer membrane murein-binding lipoprotein Lpp